MARFLTASLITAALTIGAFAPMVSAQSIPQAGSFAAQSSTVSPSSSALAPNASVITTTGSSPSGGASSVSGTANGGTTGTGGTGAAKPIQYQPPSSASSSSYSFIMQLIMSLFAWLRGVAAITLDNAVYYTVVTMGNYVNNLSAVGIVWQVLRDIGNIVLIFGFLAIGITTILNVNWYGGGTKMLPVLLLAAVFLNFSLFISEAVIDAGNLFATEFYTQINGGKPPQPVNPLSLTAIHNEGLSNKIMSQLGLQTIYGDAQNTTLVYKPDSSWLLGFMGILLFMVAAFVMFSLAYILIARFVILIFLIIIAPIGIAGLAVPKLNNSANKWWSALFEQTITAPVLLLLLYIALRVITYQSFLTGFGGGNQSAWTGWLTGNGGIPGFAGMMLSFLVAMGLLLAVVIFSKRMSAFGGSWATKTAGMATFGATAWGMNRTVGRGAYYAGRGLRQSAAFNKFDAVTGGRVSRTLDRAATGSFDVRGTKALGSIGVDAGKAQKGGFEGARKQNIKEQEEAAKRIEEANKEGFSERDKRKAIAEAIAEAEGKERAARLAYGQAKPVLEKEVEQHKAAIAQHEQDVARLEADEQRRTQFGISSAPEDLQKLASARQNLTTSKEDLAASEAKLGTAAQKLSEATENLKKVTEEAEKTAPAAALRKKIEGNKTAYAEGLNSPIAFVTSGPGASAAARKIKDSLKEKPTKVKVLDMAQKIVEELEEGEKKTSGGEEKKPEAEH